MATSPLFGWEEPDDTDLVKDGAAAIRTLGNAIDTSMGDLLGGTTGQILAKNSATSMDFTWITNDVGDITAVTVTSPITGGGTSGSVGIAIQDASTAQRGSVQLSDSTSTTSSVLAATPTAVKAAYDLADAAIAKSTLTTAGDIVYRNATVPVRLAIGTAGQVLKVNSGATAPEWGLAAGGSFNTSLATVATDQTTTSTSYVDLATAGPAVTVTTGTKALVSIKASMANGAALTGQMMGVAVSGATTVAASDTYGTGYKYIGGPTNFQPVMAATFLITGLTAGSNTFTAKYRSITGDTIYFKERMISVVDLGS
jgi:hypothetical protein